MKNIVKQEYPIYIARNKNIENFLQKYLPTNHIIELKLSLIILFILLMIIIIVIINKFIFKK